MVSTCTGFLAEARPRWCSPAAQPPCRSRGPARHRARPEPDFFLQALVWIGLVVAAVAAIRAGNRTRHMWLMLAVAAVASGAFWLRLSSWAAVHLGLTFETAYALAAWLSWMLPAGLIGLVARSRGR